MTDAPLILDDGKSPIRTLRLNRPKARNALSLELMQALRGAISDATMDQTTRVIILAGEGPAFCAGHDLRELTALRDTADGGRAAFQETFETCAELMRDILTCPLPVIARVHGMATAAGCQLVATCDLAVAAEDAKFATPGVNIGLFCSTPMVALSRNVPRKAALEMLLTGEPVSASEALRLGLVNRVVPADELETKTIELANTIAAKPRSTVRIGKEAFYRQLELGQSAAYDYTATVMAENMLEADAKEGISAFVEKRKPKWSED